MPTKPRFWYLTPIFILTLFIASLNTDLRDWSFAGTFHFASNNGEYNDLGYIRADLQPTIAFTTWINRPSGENNYTWFTNGVPVENQQVRIYRIYVGPRFVGSSHWYFNFVKITGPVAKNTFYFFPNTGKDVVFHNFDKLTIEENSVIVEINGKSERFENGHWGYRSNSKSPIIANDGVVGYTTKGGFGSVCSEINAECPYTSVELYANTADHWVYYPGYNHEITVTP